MNTLTARALTVGVLIALWAWVASVARLHVSLWAGVIALGCFFAAGGGVPGPQKNILAPLSGGLWGLRAPADPPPICGGDVGGALIFRGTASPAVPQLPPPPLSLPS